MQQGKIHLDELPFALDETVFRKRHFSRCQLPHQNAEACQIVVKQPSHEFMRDCGTRTIDIALFRVVLFFQDFRGAPIRIKVPESVTQKKKKPTKSREKKNTPSHHTRTQKAGEAEISELYVHWRSGLEASDEYIRTANI